VALGRSWSRLPSDDFPRLQYLGSNSRYRPHTGICARFSRSSTPGSEFGPLQSIPLPSERKAINQKFQNLGGEAGEFLKKNTGCLLSKSIAYEKIFSRRFFFLKNPGVVLFCFGTFGDAMFILLGFRVTSR
jgi:hypothetical protein